MRKELIYVAPEAEVLSAQVEQGFQQSGVFEETGSEWDS